MIDVRCCCHTWCTVWRVGDRGVGRPQLALEGAHGVQERSRLGHKCVSLVDAQHPSSLMSTGGWNTTIIVCVLPMLGHRRGS